MDSYNDDVLRNLYNIAFNHCRISVSSATRKYLSFSNVNGVSFNYCSFDGSTQSDALTLDGFSTSVAFIESANTYGGLFSGLSATQLDNAIAQGTRCYSSDLGTKRIVGAGSPAAAFANAWTNIGGATPSAAYWFDHEGYVCLQGLISTGTINLTAFTLPVGYRSTVQRYFPATSNDLYGTIEIQTDGDVIPRTGSNVSFSLNGIRFRTDGN
jgi:hypothetical protein